ncbi:hypothetical protein ACFLQI_00495 [Candidatus Undinarchaeota archaeon]
MGTIQNPMLGEMKMYAWKGEQGEHSMDGELIQEKIQLQPNQALSIDDILVVHPGALVKVKLKDMEQTKGEHLLDPLEVLVAEK